MRFLIILNLVFLFATTSQANPLRYEEFDVRFTNPTCKDYVYDQEVFSEGGTRLERKPKDAYCSRADATASAGRASSPQAKLIEWIKDEATSEIFMAYLSFSNADVENELCAAIEQRSLKLTFVLDSGTSLSTSDRLLRCLPANGDETYRPRRILAGNVGGIGFAHNKIFVVNPNSPEKLKLAFSSGNLSSGTVLHHENWNFITVPIDTYFAQAHKCLIEGILNHSPSKKVYAAFISECKKAITHPEESDIKTFFIPGEGVGALDAIKNATATADELLVAAHRFSHRDIVDALIARRTSSQAQVKFLGDDDIFWAGKHLTVGPNTYMEFRFVEELLNAGVEVRYLETNHFEQLLQHNKFLIFNNATESGVFAGAGNLTKAAFKDNMENFYFITIPAVVEQFNTQYRHMWDDLATSPANMPNKNVKPRVN